MGPVRHPLVVVYSLYNSMVDLLDIVKERKGGDKEKEKEKEREKGKDEKERGGKRVGMDTRDVFSIDASTTATTTTTTTTTTTVTQQSKKDNNTLSNSGNNNARKVSL